MPAKMTVLAHNSKAKNRQGWWHFSWILADGKVRVMSGNHNWPWADALSGSSLSDERSQNLALSCMHAWSAWLAKLLLL